MALLLTCSAHGAAPQPITEWVEKKRGRPSAVAEQKQRRNQWDQEPEKPFHHRTGRGMEIAKKGKTFAMNGE